MNLKKRRIKRVVAVFTFIATIATIVQVCNELYKDYLAKNSQADGNEHMIEKMKTNSMENIKGDNIHVEGNDNTVITGDNINVTQISGNADESSDPTAKLKEVSLDYLAFSDERMKNIFLWNYSDLSSDDKMYYVNNNCCTRLLAGNNSENEYEITKLSFYAENIRRDFEPYFISWLVNRIVSDEERYVTLELLNDGWGDAHDIKLCVKDESSVLYDYLDTSNLQWEVEQAEAGQIISMRIWDNSMLLKYPDDTLEFGDCELEIVSKEKKITIPMDFFYIDSNGIWAQDVGAPSASIYGIAVDSSIDSFEFSEDISEFIKPNSIIDIPICFFPDMSCSMDFYIELEIFDGKEFFSVKTDVKSIYFRVSHSAQYINENIEFADVANQNPYLDLYSTFMTFPYDRKAGVTHYIIDNEDKAGRMELHENDYITVQGEIVYEDTYYYTLQLQYPIYFEGNWESELMIPRTSNYSSYNINEKITITGQLELSAPWGSNAGNLMIKNTYHY